MQKITFTSNSYNNSNANRAKPDLRIVKPSYEYEVQQDYYDFADCPIEEKRNIFQKIGDYFSNKTTEVNALTDTQAYDKACINLCEAIRKRKIGTELIKFAEVRGFREMLGVNGNRITFDFEKDPMQRGLMLEWDENNELKSMTIFSSSTLEISRIEEKETNSRKYNRYSFFESDCKNVEIKKGIQKSGYYTCINPSYTNRSIDDMYTLNADKSANEIYFYQKGEPVSLKRNCKMGSYKMVSNEVYNF